MEKIDGRCLNLKKIKIIIFKGVFREIPEIFGHYIIFKYCFWIGILDAELTKFFCSSNSLIGPVFLHSGCEKGRRKNWITNKVGCGQIQFNPSGGSNSHKQIKNKTQHGYLTKLN